jgi:hypothetical protein
MTFGTPEEVIEATKTALRQGMPGGGFILSSSNSIHSGVKPENYLAILCACGLTGCDSDSSTEDQMEDRADAMENRADDLEDRADHLEDRADD